MTQALTLAAALGFSEDDLAYNRAAALSPAQRSRLEARAWRTVWLGGALFLAFALVATLCFFVAQQDNSLILFFIGVFLTMCNALLLGYSARQWLRLSADLRADAPVQRVEGALERVIRPYGRVSNYLVRVEQRAFSVEKETFKAFTHQARYCLYYTAHTGALLSAEPL